MYTLTDAVDGNAFSLMGYTRSAMKSEGFSKDEINEYYEKAKSGDYNNLICVSLDYLELCNKRHDKVLYGEV